MMKVVTAEEMRIIDQETIKNFGIPGPVLMERAGLSVADKIKELFEKKKVIVLSGGGNNGGDGLVVARNLHNQGWNVKVLLMQKENKLSPDCLSQYRIAKKTGVPVEFRTAISKGDIHSAIVVDAILGTGINKPVTSPIADIISFLNKSNATVVSVDIPSGISSDNAQVMGVAVRADYTVTFGLPKVGHLLYPGADFTGKLFIEEIGFPKELLSSEKNCVQTIEKSDAVALLPERIKNSHKGDYGHVLIVAGSRGKTGAALLSARACLRTGAGMVTLGVPDTLADVFQGRVLEEMVLPLPDTGKGVISAEAFPEILNFLDSRADVLAIGPGITNDNNIASLICNLLATVTTPIVMDADAINALSTSKSQKIMDIFRSAKAPVILTPHIGEMARLLQKAEVKSKNSEENKLRMKIEKDRINTALSFSKETGTYLVLKGAPTIISEPDGNLFINTTGNPGMATAGSGDVLTGMIAALLGQGLNPLESSGLGVYLHGLSGDYAASQKGMHSLIASDIIDNISASFSSLQCR